jgi:protein-arginine kinase activator protein McsA
MFAEIVLVRLFLELNVVQSDSCDMTHSVLQEDSQVFFEEKLEGCVRCLLRFSTFEQWTLLECFLMNHLVRIYFG